MSRRGGLGIRPPFTPKISAQDEKVLLEFTIIEARS
jgi:hypothetical protein